MQKKIRILHIAQATGGVDRYLKMLFKYMNTSKFENILICSNSYKKSDYRNLVISFEQVEMSRAIEVHDLKAVFIIRKLIKKYQPDIVYAHSSKAGALARLADIGLHNKCIYNPHGWSFNMRCSKKKQIIYTVIERIAALFCDRIICISEAEWQSALKNKICRNQKLQVIFNGVDVEEYDKYYHGTVSRKMLHIPEDAVVIGMAGRLCQQKAPDVFIHAVKLIKNDIPNVFCIIVGSGDMEGEVQEYARNNGLEKSLLITGWVQNPMDYIKQFDIAMLLSRWEGFGLVLPEYMMAGKPIIASRVDAIPNIIDDHKNGLLVDVDDSVGAYKAAIELLTDKVLSNNLVTCGRADVYSKFNAKRVAKEHERLFQKLIHQEER